MNLCEAVSIFIAGIVVVTALFDGLRLLSPRAVRPLFWSGAAPKRRSGKMSHSPLVARR